MSTVSSCAFNQDVSAAKRAASVEPLIITDRGVPSHVLLSFEQYRELVADQRSIVDWLSAEDDIELEPMRAEIALEIPDL